MCDFHQWKTNYGNIGNKDNRNVAQSLQYRNSNDNSSLHVKGVFRNLPSTTMQSSPVVSKI